jgi:predicted RNase H-like nuclease (RuvC/YqgF family)
VELTAQASRHAGRADAAEQAAAALEQQLAAKEEAIERLQTSLAAQTEVLKQLQSDLEELDVVMAAERRGSEPMNDVERAEAAALVSSLKREVAMQAATTARLRTALEQSSSNMEDLLATNSKNKALVERLTKDLATQ